MRKAIFFFFLLLGIGAGYLSASNDDWGLRVGMMTVGAMFGGAIGGGLSQIGKRQAKFRHQWRTEEEVEPIPGMGTSSRDLAANFWRDKGQPPFTRMPDAEPDKHMFDPDRIG
ncbi:hypothetical protein [Paracidovorax anthurii]|uniref:Uncharacterized protein n=1 Tax=Paracidovorax anthurii TaxID=78229 RepID=A0A328ZDT2_9BURK|nr:hypothetical protein [Paracidovorax anthurii]RAR83563.1 hypothetical protein AX018_101472 [Paracidovorax anthurii]